MPNLLLVAFSLAIGLAVAEFAVRILEPQPLVDIDNHLYTRDTSLRYRLNPGYHGRLSNLADFDGIEVAINSQGMRNEELGRKQPAETRLLLLGDSFAFGWGVEQDETFAAQLEAGLRTDMPTVRVLNGGVPGYGPVDIVAWLEAYGLDLEPDIVLVTLFLGNDLIDATEKHRQVDFAATPADGSEADRLRDAIYRRSHVVRLLKRTLPASLIRQIRGSEPWSVTYLRDLLESYALDETELAREGREASAVALARFAELAERHDFQPLIALLPGRLQVRDDRWQRGLDSLGADAEAYDPHRPADIFGDLAGDAGIPVTDLTPAFRAAVSAGGEPIFFRYDPHWTPDGHLLAARELYDFVLTSMLNQALGQAAERAPDAEPDA